MTERASTVDPRTDPSLTPEQQRTLDDIEAHEGTLTPDERDVFDELTSDEHMVHDAEEPTTPGGYEFDASKLHIHVGDLSHGASSAARDYSDERLNEQTTQKGFKGFLKKIWHGNIARDYYTLKYQQEGREQITEGGPVENNLHVLDGGDAADDAQTRAAVISRVTNGYLHGEAQDDLADISGGDELEMGLRDLVHSFATGDIDENALHQERTRLLNEFGRDRQAADRNKGLALADNLIEVARNAKAALDHGIGLDRVAEALKVSHTEVKMGARTEARLNMVERAMNTLYKSKVGSFVNETTIMAAVSVPFIVGKFAARKVTTTALRFGGLGVGSAVLAGVREGYHLKHERSAHAREMATGGGDELATAGKRRESIEKTRYQTVPVQELINELTAAREFADTSSDDLRQALDAVVHAHVRIELSDQRAVDLIEYSGKTSVEEERFNLDMRFAEARAAVRAALQKADDAALQKAGLETRDLDEAVEQTSDYVFEQITGDMDARDKAFRSLQTKRVLAAAAIGFVTSETIGLALQEGKAALDSGMQGVFEHYDGQGRQSLLAGVFHHVQEQTGQGGKGGDTLKTINSHTAVEVPKGYHLSDVGGKWELLDAHDKVIDNNMTFNSHGQMTEATQKALEAKGFHFSKDVKSVAAEWSKYHTVHRTPQGYINAHPDQFTHVDRDLWYDENTPSYSDLNELKMDWGGVNGSGIDAHGNYVFSVANMGSDGSFHDGLSANAQQLIHEGKMNIALSVTQGTQSHVLMVHVNEQGLAVIDKNSFAGQNLFADNGGQAQFTGAYAEAVQLLGKDNDGVQHMRMLATVVGENKVSQVTDHVRHLIPAYNHTTTTLLPPAEAAPLIEVPPSIPVRARKGLEYATVEAEPVPPLTEPDEDIEGNLDDYMYDDEYYDEYYYDDADAYGNNQPGGSTGEHRRRRRVGHPVSTSGRLKRMREWVNAEPGRLRARREVIGPDGRTEWLEADGSPVERKVDRERTTLQNYLDGLRTDDPDHMSRVDQIVSTFPAMSDDCRVAVFVPAMLEEKALKGLLTEYVPQQNRDGSPLNPELFEINVLVNHKQGTPGDDSMRVIEEFLDEYEATHGYRPHVNAYDIELPERVATVGYARKLITDSIMQRSLNRTSQAEPLYIETEDADLLHVDKKTVSNLIRKLDANPQLDLVSGVTDRAPEYMKENDYLFLRRRLNNFAHILIRSKEYRDPTHPGWNYTWNRVISSGWNAGYSAEALAMIGGYENRRIGEDMIIGERISMVRGDGRVPNLEVIGRIGTRSDSSPRRYISAIRRNSATYSGFGRTNVDQELRDKGIPELLDEIKEYNRITPENEGSFTEMINHSVRFMSTVTPTAADARHLSDRLLFFIGFHKDDYEIDSHGHVTINNWDNVSAALERYRLRAGDRAARAGGVALAA